MRVPGITLIFSFILAVKVLAADLPAVDIYGRSLSLDGSIKCIDLMLAIGGLSPGEISYEIGQVAFDPAHNNLEFNGFRPQQADWDGLHRNQADQNSKLVYDAFKLANRKKRQKFSPEFIRLLKDEDKNLPLHRLMYFSFYRNMKTVFGGGEPVAFVSLFDGTEVAGDPTSALPLERKRPAVVLRERQPRGKRVFEIRRLGKVPREDAVTMVHIVRAIADYLEALKMEDAVLYVHTDKAGRDLFTSRFFFHEEFGPQQIGAEDEYVLRQTAAEFIGHFGAVTPPTH